MMMRRRIRTTERAGSRRLGAIKKMATYAAVAVAAMTAAIHVAEPRTAAALKRGGGPAPGPSADMCWVCLDKACATWDTLGGDFCVHYTTVMGDQVLSEECYEVGSCTPKDGGLFGHGGLY